MFRPVLAVAVLTGLLAPLPALAGNRTAMVPTADINLATSEGRDQLSRRIKAAARAVCGDVNVRELAMAMAVKRCTQNAIDGTRQQIARIQSRTIVASR